MRNKIHENIKIYNPYVYWAYGYTFFFFASFFFFFGLKAHRHILTDDRCKTTSHITLLI